MYRRRAPAQIAREMVGYQLDILGSSESRWTRAGKIVYVLVLGLTVIFSEDKELDEGGGAKMISQNAAKLLMEWTPISLRNFTARVYTRYRILAMIQVCAPIMKRKRKNSFTKRYKKHLMHATKKTS